MTCNKRLTVYSNNSETRLLSLYGKLLKTCKNYPLIFARILWLFLKEYYSNLSSVHMILTIFIQYQIR